MGISGLTIHVLFQFVPTKKQNKKQKQKIYIPQLFKEKVMLKTISFTILGKIDISESYSSGENVSLICYQILNN